MVPDIGSTAVDVAIGLAFVFFLLSTLVSACTELFAWITKQRAQKLESGVRGLLGDNEIADEVLAHSLVQSDVTTGPDQNRPSYLSSRNFSLALIDVLASRGSSEAGDRREEVESAVRGLGEDASALEEQLRVLLGESSQADLADLRVSLETWFDDAMDRVSGWYKRWAQKITLIAAIVLTLVLNINAVKIAETLANEPTVRAAVAARGQAAAESEVPPDAFTSGKSAEYAVDNLESLQVPILWNGATDDFGLSHLAGWLITILAVSLGAPFWFDALSRLSRLRTTGKRPEPAGEN